MQTLRYKIIKKDAQYYKYCDRLEQLDGLGRKTRLILDEIELLSLLIEKYDEEHNTLEAVEPVELLKSLMKEHKIKAVELANLLEVSEGLVSDMLSHKKGFSKHSIRILSKRFKLRQEAFNRPYELKQKSKQRRIKPKNPRKKTAA